MGFKNYDDFPPPPPVEIPIGARVYAFPGTISARAWVMLDILTAQLSRAKLAAAKGQKYDPDLEALSDGEYADLRVELFGPTEQALIRDSVSGDCMKRLFMTLVAYHVNGREIAERVWNQGERATPNRAQRRSAQARTSAPVRGSRAGSKRTSPARPGTRSSNTGR